MLYINAYEETDYDPESGYVNFPYSVGKFIIPEGTPPFTPVLVKLTPLPEYRNEAFAHMCAWVAHDGVGGVQGDTTDPATDEEVARWFADPTEYHSPDDCDGSINVGG